MARSPKRNRRPRSDSQTTLVWNLCVQLPVLILINRNVFSGGQGKDSSSKDDSDTDSESEPNPITPDEKMKILNIGIRDLRLGPAFSTLSDCKPRQLAYVLAGVYPWSLPTDLLEIGGELDSWSNHPAKPKLSTVCHVCCKLVVCGS